METNERVESREEMGERVIRELEELLPKWGMRRLEKLPPAAEQSKPGRAA